jgi:GntR family transcriptional regulator/MocR family aminotransferase
VTVDRDGIVVDDIPAEARAVYVTPSHQSPTGVTMSAARRKALLALATRHDQAVIEDDYDTEYRYVDRPLEPIQRLDTAGRVVYVGTFSKILSPSLRLGFVVGPEPLIEELGDVRALCYTEPPHLTQAALAALIGEGHLDRHLRRARRIYAARHRLVTEHANRLCAEGLIPHVLRSNAGLHTMIGLPDHCAPSDLAARLARNGIAIDVAADCWLSGRPDPVIAIGFGQADLDHLAAGLQQLRAELVAAAASTP